MQYVFFLIRCLRKTASLTTSLLPFLVKNVVVFPSRAVAIENALRLFSPRLAIVDEHLTRHLPRQWLTSLNIEVSASSYTIVHFNLFFLKYNQFGFEIQFSELYSIATPSNAININ